MRGTRLALLRFMFSFGLIPTYAGNTRCRIGHLPRDRAHPHVCGEHTHALSNSGNLRGSSPRMRGTLFSLVVECQLKGLIPTYAGNTSCGDEVSVFDGAHPHVCGEHFWTVKESSSTLGSSPRMRGTLRFRVDRFTVDGLIPTYAGNTRLRRRRAGRRRAHPHVCGEHSR